MIEDIRVIVLLVFIMIGLPLIFTFVMALQIF